MTAQIGDWTPNKLDNGADQRRADTGGEWLTRATRLEAAFPWSEDNTNDVLYVSLPFGLLLRRMEEDNVIESHVFAQKFNRQRVLASIDSSRRALPAVCQKNSPAPKRTTCLHVAPVGQALQHGVLPQESEHQIVPNPRQQQLPWRRPDDVDRGVGESARHSLDAQQLARRLGPRNATTEGEDVAAGIVPLSCKVPAVAVPLFRNERTHAVPSLRGVLQVLW